MTTINLHDYVPRYYEEVRVAVNVLDREADELAQLNADIYDVLAQFFIETATWGLDRWERIFGIATDSTKSYAQRREVLLGKLRGVGTVTGDLIDNVASAYANGNVDVTANPANYEIIITFVDAYGVPAQINELKAAVRDITPAHMAITYVFRFYSYDELKASGKTYAQIAATGLTYNDVYNRGLA
ncbi:putative phage tail protein [Paenibacillus sediminis]|uniref:DUF2313 domain-containing protein n=1 Tax=Paenibacillus sediminis TaxID=664909 RepID=A0ABS4H6Q2_9BACL|nr:putative phage tail protein [Paenibacillus sediminis]MBP1938205.1 hypothetical protein [Paenibacillus sediminis]